MALHIIQKATRPFRQLVTGQGKVIFIFLTVLLSISVLGLIIIALFFDVSQNSFGRTLTNTLLTIISTGVIGTLLSVLVTNHQKIQLRETNRDQFRKDILQSLNKIYSKIKNARRMIRAKGFTVPYYRNEDDNHLLSLSVYELYMKVINDCQLELESWRHEIITNEYAFSNPRLIIGNLKDMDNYLSKIVSEYEQCRPAFFGEPPARKIGELKEMKLFLVQAREGLFNESFTIKCNGIRNEIRKDINFFDRGTEESSSNS